MSEIIVTLDNNYFYIQGTLTPEVQFGGGFVWYI